jgi:hypothetical protein
VRLTEFSLPAIVVMCGMVRLVLLTRAVLVTVPVASGAALGACAAGRETPGDAAARARSASVLATVAAPSNSSPPGATTARLLGLPPPPTTGPLPGYLLIADRDNNRIIIVTSDHRVVWTFPAAGDLASGQQFMGPDDAFLSPDGRSLTTNEEFSDAIAQIALGAHPHIVWQYGHPGTPGSAHGYLSHPDDAYLLPDGRIVVADIINCRVLFLDRAARVVRSIGHAGDCAHEPPRAIASPNGDTPLPDGGLLVTEIGGWIDRFDRAGRLLYSVPTPTSYPSDAQLLPDGNLLVAGFNTPGRIDVITPHGHIVWSYHPSSGPSALDRPSLAVPLPGGIIAATDDWHHRVVLIRRASKRIVWQYGHTGVPGRARGYLDKPDGLQLIG